MNILIIGAGGREHCFAWKIKQSAHCNELFIAPGNAGTENLGTNLDIAVTDFENLANAALTHNITLILVGPEEPLVKGIVAFFNNNEATKHIKIIGPSAEAAQLEGSKAFAKDFMTRHSIPTAAYMEFTQSEFEKGIAYIEKQSMPLVLKADGLAAGKGVLICTTHEEAKEEFELMLIQSKFGEAGNKVVIEAFLQGIEMSVFVLTDGKNYVFLPEAKDYKRIGEGDTGLNTGGMGAVSPVPIMNAILKEKIISKIIEPTIKGFQKDKLPYKGFVFVGLMINDNEPYVIEYNCRMGDPETEVVIPRIQNDLVDLLLATSNETLNSIDLQTKEETAVGIVAVSGGYPGVYKKGDIIRGLDYLPSENELIFHAGTKKDGDNIVTNGGRVLVSVSFEKNITAAAKKSSNALAKIIFDNCYFRKDIGYEFP
jgi:phosphoribosylamine---glycine ligase